MGERNFVQEMDALGRQIAANNSLLLQNVNMMIQKSEMRNRKTRKKRTGERLLASEGTYLGMVRLYDDGSSEFLKISTVLTGENKVYNVNFQGMEHGPKFGIFFVREQIWIIGDKGKVSPRYLYDCFVKAAGPFHQDMPITSIGKLLYDYFATKIELASREMIIPALAGWSNDRFLHKNNFTFIKTKDMPDLPVFHKDFHICPLEEKHMSAYFRELNRISRWRERLLISLYPYGGILASVFNEMHRPIGFSLNFIELDSSYRKEVCSWLKIFNRSSLMPVSLDMRDKELKNILTESNDEVLIFDATCSDNMSNYQKNKVRRNIKNIIDALRKKIVVQDDHVPSPCFGVAFFSDARILESGVQNIFLDKNFFNERTSYPLLFAESRAMEAVMSDFVHYAEKNVENIWSVILKRREGVPEDECVVWNLYDIVTHYWKERGIDFEMILELPDKISGSTIVQIQDYGDDELIDLFVKAMRKGLQKFRAVEKGDPAEHLQKTFFYSEDSLWVPTKMLRVILSKEGIFPYLNMFLLLMKEKGYMLTDCTGFSRKIHVSGTPVETYCFKRESFNGNGLVDIVDLAKGAGYDS